MTVRDKGESTIPDFGQNFEPTFHPVSCIS